MIVCQEALASSHGISQSQWVESCLHNDTVTHLNSEITLKMSFYQAVEWLKSTFYTRVTKLRHYNISSYGARQHGKKVKWPKNEGSSLLQPLSRGG